MKLTPDRIAVLKAIDSKDTHWDGPPDHHMIAVRCGKIYNASDWAHAKLRALLDAGLIRVAGKILGARAWALTDEGRRVLAEAEGEKNG